MLENISSIVVLIMMLLTFADVVGRYLLHRAVFGATEMIAALLAFAIFAGLGVINARDDHIGVELFEEPFRRVLTPTVYEIIIQAFSVACMILIALALFQNALESYERSKLTTVLEMPVHYVTGTIALLAVISVLCQAAGVALKIVDQRGASLARPS